MNATCSGGSKTFSRLRNSQRSAFTIYDTVPWRSCFAQHVNIKAISELLGHSSVAFTLEVYGHLLCYHPGAVLVVN